MEILIGSGVAACLIYTAVKWKETDVKKIQHVFRNTNYRVKDHDPRLIKTIRKENFTEYVYSVPYGLIDDPKLQNILEKTLIKPVTVKFRGKLIIKVYKNKLSKNIKYDWKKTDGWKIPIGFLQEKTLFHDFDKIPHMTIAGATRQGKTVLLKLIMTHLINQNDVEFYIIDLKGGLEFSKYKNLKPIRNVACNITETYQLLKEIETEIKKDMQYFKEKGHSNILDTPIEKRKFIIVDEGAELTPAKHHTKEEKQMFNYCQHVLSEVARVAGALGYRLIFSTQYPTADTLPRQIKQNADAKVSFRLPTEIASRVAIDEQGAEKLECPGRAVYRTHEKHIIQVPFIEDKKIKENLRRFEVNDSTREETNQRGEDSLTIG